MKKKNGFIASVTYSLGIIIKFKLQIITNNKGILLYNKVS